MIVRAARDGDERAPAALEELCRLYWYPLYAFVRRQGHGPDEARDLTQEFFAQLLGKNFIAAADPGRGKFRTFLLVALKRMLGHERERAQALKRGGGVAHVALDAEEGEELYRLEPATDETPERLYERRWAQSLLETVIARVRQECDAAGRAGRFEVLKVFLIDERPEESYAEAAARLGLSESAVKSAIFRLRQRYAEIFREEIGRTVSSPLEVDEEIRHLLEILSGRG